MSIEKKQGKIHIFEDNINTDIIISGQYLRTPEPSIFAEHVFEVLKGPHYNQNVNEGDVIFAKNNFGCGSSREQAALAIKYAKFKYILAKSYGRIFYRNIVNQGIYALEINEDINIEELMKQIKDGDEIEVDLEYGKAYIGENRVEVTFNKPSKFLSNIIEAGGLLAYAKKNSINTR